MKTRNVFLLILTFILWLGLDFGCSIFRKATNNKGAIPAEDLYRAYQTNEADADKLYKGKIVIVTGTIGAVRTARPDLGLAGGINLVDSRQKPIVNCFGFDSDQNALAKLRPGQEITVKCKGAGKIAGFPSLDDCALQ